MARLLVTNDDGIHGPGLHALAVALAGAGHEVVVVAPDHDASGTGASLGGFDLSNALAVRRAELPGGVEVEAHALAGPPAMCVLAAVLGAFGEEEFDAIVSGINSGANTGRAILHSGTVGAALTAQNFGLRGLAVSMAEPPRSPGGVRVGPAQWHWTHAADLAAEVVGRLLDGPARITLNLNVPHGGDERPPLRWARLGTFGSVRSTVKGVEEGKLQFELVAVDEETRPDSDSALLRDGVATLTAIGGLAELWARPPEGPADPADVESTAVTGPSDFAVEAHAAPGDELSPAHLFPDPEVAEHLFPRPVD